ncbi:lytic transglycosylase domain-containing protein [Sphingomonas guangdongensis]|nr:lytic transglycosylase domain-containing protein [Sphingomonas guangdongensis]
MLGWVLRSGGLIAGASGVAVAATMAHAPIASRVAWVGAQVAPSFTPAPVATAQPAQSQPVVTDPLLNTVEQWKRLQNSDNLPFAEYASFLLAHPGWPGERSRRAAAETVGDTYPPSPALVAQFFERYPPLTAAGRIRHAVALQQLGQPARAAEQARAAWRMGVLRSADEARVLASFPAALTAADHDARIDMLLWQGATSAATRQMAFASAIRRPVLEARLALRTNAADAAARSAALEATAATDAGFVADRAAWLRQNGASASARALLARPRTLAAPPAAPEKWFEVLLTNARAATADNQHLTAYDIARQVDDVYPVGTDIALRPLGERDDYTSLVWLAGTTAMQRLARPRDAIGQFDRYARGSRTPTTQSKGLYWAGRAAEAAGHATLARSYLSRAAGYGDLYYGQLAAERLRQPLRAPAAAAAQPIDPGARAAFGNREVVRAARLLGTLGRRQEQGLFLRQIAADATTASDHALAGELARTINRPDLGVLVGKSALENGLSDYTVAGYPSVTVPAAAQDSWTMVHAIARQESQFDRAAVSHAGARGLMQLMPGTAREVAGKLGLGYDASALTVDTNYNIQLGSHYFEKMLSLYGSYPLAVAAYNAGPGNVNKWLRANGDPRTPGVDMVDWVERIPIFETKNYVQRVLENAVVYDLLNPARSRSRAPNNLSWYLGKNQPG